MAISEVLWTAFNSIASDHMLDHVTELNDRMGYLTAYGGCQARTMRRQSSLDWIG